MVKIVDDAGPAWADYDRPPEATAKLVELYTWWRGKHKSEIIPDRPLDAATWWIDHQEPPDESKERPEKTYDRRGNFSGWRTPYHDRVYSNFRLFLALNEAHKAYIIHHIEAGFPWRGDPIPLYTAMVEEHFKMQEDPTPYVETAEQVRKEALNVKS